MMSNQTRQMERSLSGMSNQSGMHQSHGVVGSMGRVPESHHGHLGLGSPSDPYSQIGIYHPVHNQTSNSSSSTSSQQHLRQNVHSLQHSGSSNSSMHMHPAVNSVGMNTMESPHPSHGMGQHVQHHFNNSNAGALLDVNAAASKRRRGSSSSELLDFDDFLGAMPSEPVSAYTMFGHSDDLTDKDRLDPRRDRENSLDGLDFPFALPGIDTEIPSDSHTLTTQEHCLVMAQRLLEMARRNENCDLDVVLSCSNSRKTNVLHLHSSYACASSPVLRMLLIEKQNGRSLDIGSKSMKRELLEQSSPSGHSIGGETDSYDSTSTKSSHHLGLLDEEAAQLKKLGKSMGSSSKIRKIVTGDINRSSINNSSSSSSAISSSSTSTTNGEPLSQHSSGAFGHTTSAMRGAISSNLVGTSLVAQQFLSSTRVSTRLEGGFTRIVLELQPGEFDIQTLEAVRIYMYTGILQFTSRSVFKILQCAECLAMKPLTELALEYVRVNICEENLLDIIRVAKSLAIAPLLESATEFLADRFDSIAVLPLWKDLPGDLVQDLIRRDSLRTENEVAVFRALAEWANADPATRNDLFNEMICNDLRLANMTRTELMELSKHEACIASKAVRRALYDEAVSRVQGPNSRRPQQPRMYGNDPSNSRPASQSSVGTADMEFSGPLKLSHCERTITDHTRPVCGLAVVGKYVIAASGDRKLLVFNSENDWRCERVLEGHEMAVVALKVVDGKLITASPDKTIRIWSTKTWSCIRTLHTGKSFCSMAVVGNKLVAGSDDGFLKSWSMEGWGLLRTVPAHQHVVWALTQYGNNTLISGSSDTLIKVWSVNQSEFNLVRTIKAHNDEVQALTVETRKHWLFSGSDDGTILIHDCKTWTLLRTIGWQGRAVLSLLNFSNGIIAGLGNGCVVVWDKETILTHDECIVTLAEHKSCVMALAVLNGKLLTASFDKTIKVWGP